MREIKFRGRKPNGEWVNGDLVATELTDGKPTKKEILPYDKTTIDEAEYVVQDTIGQFTGLRDKNGVEIYEGDILRGFEYPYYNADNDAFNYYAIVDWDESDAQFYVYNDLARDAQVRGASCGVGVDMGYLRDMEIIGNIYDNLGLLKA